MLRALVTLLCSLALTACEFQLPLASSTPELAPLGAPLGGGTGTQVFQPSLQLGPDGEPVVAYVVMETAGAERALHAMRWTGEAWSPMAPPLKERAWCPQVRLDPAGHPVVAFLSQRETFPTIAVFRWSGEAWETLTEAHPIGPGRRGYECPALAIGPEGEPLLATVGYDMPIGAPSTDNTHVHVHRWTGSGWEQLGEQLNTDGRVSGFNTLAMHTDSQGRPVVAWAQWTANQSTSAELRLARWETGIWRALGGPEGQRVYAPKLVVDAEDRPVVAWVQEPISPLFLASSAAPDLAQAGLFTVPGAVRVARLEGKRWVSLGGEVRARSDVEGVGGVSLSLDAQGTPWMAWRESGNAGIFVQLARWTGMQWELVAHDLRASSHYRPNGPSPTAPGLGIDALGRPVVAWEEGLLHVRRAVH